MVTDWHTHYVGTARYFHSNRRYHLHGSTSNVEDRTFAVGGNLSCFVSVVFLLLHKVAARQVSVFHEVQSLGDRVFLCHATLLRRSLAQESDSRAQIQRSEPGGHLGRPTRLRALSQPCHGGDQVLG